MNIRRSKSTFFLPFQVGGLKNEYKKEVPLLQPRSTSPNDLPTALASGTLRRRDIFSVSESLGFNFLQSAGSAALGLRGVLGPQLDWHSVSEAGR